MATRRLTASAARRARLDSQLLGGSDLTPAQVVARAGALQGQDLAGVLRAIAVRSRPGTTLESVREAFDRGEIVRSWPMRGTLFATTPEHLAGILASTGPRHLRSTAKRRVELGLTDEVVVRARSVALERLADRPFTRAEILAAWAEAGIESSGGRGYHLIAHLAIAGDAHWGPFARADRAGGEGAGSDRGGAGGPASGGIVTPPTEQLLTRTAEGARPQAVSDPAAALARAIEAYVRARGPVTEADLQWWTKLPLSVLRPVASAVGELETVEADGVEAWVLPDDGEITRPKRPRALLAPAFDEIILGYQDRALVADPAMQRAIVPGNNGVFRPVVLLDGRAVGTWKVPASGAREPVAEMVEEVGPSALGLIDKALAAWPHRAG
ncbi:hypothetical protein CZ771_05510 [Actinomycetales bacterium JB111]|nr:hypothetical protein CZ771_05510 [Actinomycetales bacterium JB111]